MPDRPHSRHRYNVLVTRTDVHIHALERNLEGTGRCSNCQLLLSVLDNNINLTSKVITKWMIGMPVPERTFDYYTDI